MFSRDTSHCFACLGAQTDSTSRNMSASRNMLHVVTLNWIRSDILDCCISCLLTIFRQAPLVCCIIANRCEWITAFHNVSSTHNLFHVISFSHFFIPFKWSPSSMFYDYLVCSFSRGDGCTGAKQDIVVFRRRSSASTFSSQRCDWIIGRKQDPWSVGSSYKRCFPLNFKARTRYLLTLGQTGVTRIRWRVGTPVALGRCFWSCWTGECHFGIKW